MSSFPILTRAARTQWRDQRSFVLLLVLAGLFTGFLIWRYADESVSYSSTREIQERLRAVGQSLWWQIAWLQTAVALLVAPAQTAGTIARERERGLLENLMLAPLSPARIVLEKWLSALSPLLLILLVLFPFTMLVVLLGGIGTQVLVALLSFQILLAATGAAIGLACSAWARRAHLALRSAYGLVTLWILGSGAAAYLAGDSFLGGFPGSYVAPFYMKYIGRTNPLLGASDLIITDSTGDRWLAATLFLAGLTLLCLWTATRALRKSLVEAPFIETKRAGKASKTGARKTLNSDHFEVPVVGALHFANPVMGREVRSKFRLRQPPVAVIVFEGILALAVAYFYARTLWTALTDDSTRGIIFWGVAITGLIVTLISCAIMGANGFSREHEGGTWESLRLSLLRPREIVAGKFWGIALTCALFSLPVWPLLLPCVAWSGSFYPSVYNESVSISQLFAVALIWLGCVVAVTLWGLWLGLRTRKSSSASGAALGTSAAWLLGVPLFLLTSGAWSGETWAAALNPFVALGATGSWRHPDALTQLGLPFLAVALGFGTLMWVVVMRVIARQLGIRTYIK